jgi:hypothetical protein
VNAGALRAPCPRAGTPLVAVTVTAAVFALLLACVPDVSGAWATPLESGVSSSSGSWVVLPMGMLSQQLNTFWQLLHVAPGSSRWSVVTPPGVADNGGLVAAASQSSILVGFLPNALLRFSPLAQSSDDGSTWSPVFLPGGLAVVPDALAYEEGNPGGALAVVGSRLVFETGTGLGAWSPIASSVQLRRASPRCGVSGVSAVAYSGSGEPMVAANCSGGGMVGLFTRRAGSWHASGSELHGALGRASTSVLRLGSSGTNTIALVQATTARNRWLVAQWQTGSVWSDSPPLTVPRGGSVTATFLSLGGMMAVLARTERGGLVAEYVGPGRPWATLPTPPGDTVALADVAPSNLSFGTTLFDAFAVKGTVLSVYALTPAGTRWVLAQTIRVPIAYGSSS